MTSANIGKKLEKILLGILPKVLELLKENDLSKIETILNDLLQKQAVELLQAILQEVLNGKELKKNFGR